MLRNAAILAKEIRAIRAAVCPASPGLVNEMVLAEKPYPEWSASALQLQKEEHNPVLEVERVGWALL